MTIPDEKQYEFVTSRVAELATATHSGLKIFLPNYSAIVGGSIGLRLQIKATVPSAYIYLSDALVGLLTLICVIIVYDNLRAWTGYRELLSRLTADTRFPAPKPVQWPSAIIEYSMCGVMVAALALYVIYNPFRI
jgi:hypothetical protein